MIINVTSIGLIIIPEDEVVMLAIMMMGMSVAICNHGAATVALVAHRGEVIVIIPIPAHRSGVADLGEPELSIIHILIVW
jgi:hypothetical protein